MPFASQQIQTLAPDSQVLAAGQKLGKLSHWPTLGRQGSVVWGECKGSTLYRVQADLEATAYKCSCPSRKQPCKHVIGLLALYAADEAAVPEEAAPDWVMEWLARRAAAQTRTDNKSAEAPDGAKQKRSAVQKERRAEQRRQHVLEGMEAIELWMCDLVRNGVGSAESQPASFWERQAARLVDSEAPGLASWVRRLAQIPGSGPAWPERLLGEMGKLELIIRAFQRLDQIDPALQHDVRQLVGWRLTKEAVGAQGEHVIDDWSILGQWVEKDQLRTQRTWLRGSRTGSSALVLQFVVGAATAFPWVGAPGTRQEMELHFWPGACPQRAHIERRVGEVRSLQGREPGHARIEDFLTSVSRMTAVNPWADRFLAVLHDVVPVPNGKTPWLVRDGSGAALPLRPGSYWTLLAGSGGRPVDLYAEWDGRALLPFAARTEEEEYMPAGME